MSPMRIMKSRHKRSRMRKLREVIWPAMGWRRTMRYWRHRIVRLQDSNYSISAGFATGASISFTPIPGSHILGAMGISYLLRGNIFASVFGTLLGNPWTIPFMWWFSHLTGKLAFHAMGFEVRNLPKGLLRHFEWRQLVHEIMNDPMPIFLPWFVGGMILMILTWPIFYFFFFGLITHLRSTHHLWKTTRLRKAAREITKRDITGQAR